MLQVDSVSSADGVFFSHIAKAEMFVSWQDVERQSLWLIWNVILRIEIEVTRTIDRFKSICTENEAPHTTDQHILFVRWELISYGVIVMLVQTVTRVHCSSDPANRDTHGPTRAISLIYLQSMIVPLNTYLFLLMGMKSRHNENGFGSECFGQIVLQGINCPSIWVVAFFGDMRPPD